eukprot:764817-Hanusia_phi.AAC.1
MATPLGRPPSRGKEMGSARPPSRSNEAYSSYLEGSKLDTMAQDLPPVVLSKSLAATSESVRCPVESRRLLTSSIARALKPSGRAVPRRRSTFRC